MSTGKKPHQGLATHARSGSRPEPRAPHPGVVQPKTGAAARKEDGLVPPPSVYWPHAGRQVSQPKMPAPPRPAGPAASALQPKAGSGQPPRPAAAHRQPPPPVFWPSLRGALQPKAAVPPAAQRSARPAPVLFPPPSARPAGVIQRSHEESDVEDLAHYQCTEGHVVSFDETFDEHRGQPCPLSCKGMLYPLKGDGSDVYYCTNESCPQLDMATKIIGECIQCEKAKVQLSAQPAYVEEEIAEETLNSTERKLKSLLQNAQSFVQSSGTHHKTTRGKHTSTAREKHSSAHSSKAKVRNRYEDDIKELLESGQISNKKLIRLAGQVIGQVHNK